MNYLKILAMIACSACVSAAFAQGAEPIQVEAGSILDTFDKSYIANWRSTYIDAEKKLGERHTVYGSLRETERFAMKDREMLAGIYYPLAKRWTLLTEGNTSPTHQVIARWSALEQVQYALDGGWGAQLGLRHTEYDSALINTLLVTAERYWSNYRAAYTHSTGALADAGYAANDRMQLSFYYAERSWFGMLVSRGSEIENLGAPQGILSTEVQSTGIYGRHWLGNNWALSYDASVNMQGNYYTRNEFRLGLRHQF